MGNRKSDRHSHHTALKISKMIWKCRLCRGAAFRTPPVSGVFPTGASVLVIAQNPGEGNDNMKKTFTMDYGDFIKWYRSDFLESFAAKQLALLFDSENWHHRIAYTNLVKCRTRRNSSPSEEMYAKCSRWTAKQALALRFNRFVSIGLPAFRFFVSDGSLLDCNGKILQLNNGAKLLPLFHYSYLARQGRNYEEFQKAARLLSET